MIGEVDQSDEDWKLVDEIAMLEHLAELDVFCFRLVDVHRVNIQ